MKRIFILSLLVLCACRKNCTNYEVPGATSYGEFTVAGYTKSKAEEKCKANTQMNNNTIPPTYAIYCELK